jgi:16S rRNA G1207 methylase RsmC
MEFEFFTSPGIFSYKRIDNGTRLLIESMVLPIKGQTLDVGCGYGPIGIVAAKLMPNLEVWMTDVNERAIRLTRKNSELNGVDDVVIKQGNLYEPVGDEMFDAIISNPPISAGMRRVVEPLVKGAVDRLVVGGCLQVVIQTNKGSQTLAAFMKNNFGGVEVLARGSGYRVLMSVKN